MSIRWACRAGALLLAMSACSEEDGSMSGAVTGAGSGGMSSGGAGAGGSGGTQLAGSGAVSGTGGVAGAMVTPSGGVGGAGAGGASGTGTGGMSAGTGTGGAGGVGGGGMMAGMGGDPGPSGPVDGDPTKPMVTVEGIPCGVPMAGFGSTPPTVQIGGRDVVVAYPCMHEGAQVTFFLFLHGTLGDAQKVQFTMAAFPIHKHVESDNVIVVVPKAIGMQWGNGDDGQDLPHLYEVVDWVYATFGEKVDIRSMWASGGSWGAFYLSSTFACDPKFQDRLRGVRMVVGGGCPRCSDRLACIVAQQDLELGGGTPLTADEQTMAVDRAGIDAYATAHGCDARTGPEMLGAVRAWTWANCDDGFAHSYYLGPGEHADRWDDPVSLPHMVAEIKSIE